MNKYVYEDPVQTQNEDWTDEIEEGLFDDASSESQKSPERISREKTFNELYEAYMRPEKPLSAYRREYLLNDLYEQLTKLNSGWVYSRCARYKAEGFYDADPDEALFSGGFEVCQILKKDQENGNYCTYPVSYYLRISRNKIIDHYFRPKYGRLPSKNKDNSNEDGRKVPEAQKDPEGQKKLLKRNVDYPMSLESMVVDDSGVYHGDRNNALAHDPFEDMRLPRRESDRKSIQLSTLYVSELMDYPNEPQKPLAAMYGSVLFQLAKEMEGTRLAETARKSTKLSSASWAHQAMSNLTLEKLGNVSEKIVRRYFERDLAWGQDFRQYMTRHTDSGLVWGQIVYTASYAEDDTSNWIESIFKSTMQKCARKLAGDAQMREFAAYAFNPKGKIRKAIAKIEQKKEACR